MRVLLTLLASLTLFTPSYAAIEERAVTARGEGVSLQSALQQALANAVGEAFGIELSSESLSSSVATTVDTSDLSAAVFVDVLSQAVREKVSTNDNQPVTGYRVLSDRHDANGWIVEVEMRYAYYQPVGQPSARRTAVVVGRNKGDEFLRDRVEQALVASRRFDVVTRRDQKLFDAEKSFIKGDDAGRSERARIGGAQGADYLVVVDALNFGHAVNRESILPATGEKLYDSVLNLKYSIEVLEFTTHELKWKKQFSESKSTQQYLNNGSAWVAKYVDGSLNSAIEEMISTIYPMRVISQEGETFLVNRGNQYLKGHEQFTVYKEGLALIDPETGESLGSSETEVGTAEVVEVFPKYSRLRLTSGSLSPSSDYIVRNSTKVAPRPSTPSNSTNKLAPSPQLQQKKSVFLN